MRVASHTEKGMKIIRAVKVFCFAQEETIYVRKVNCYQMKPFISSFESLTVWAAMLNFLALTVFSPEVVLQMC